MNPRAQGRPTGLRELVVALRRNSMDFYPLGAFK